MKVVKAFFIITRPLNLLITFAVVIVAAIICSYDFHFNLLIILAGFSAVLVAASGNVINDYFDFEVDKINRPNRPIPLGLISRREALTFSILLSIAAIIISYLLSSEALIIVVSTLMLLYFYSRSFKSIPIIGNATVALCSALAFLYGGSVVGNIYVAIIPAIFAFLISLIREILKDIEDLDGDKLNNVKTFPVSFGLKATINIIFIFSVFLILSTFYPFIYGIYKIEYFIIVLFFVNFPLVYFLRELSSNDFLNKLSRLSLLLKIVMIFGLISIYAGIA